MIEGISRFIQISKDRGIVTAIKSTISYLQNQFDANDLKDIYWNVLGGSQTLSLVGVSAEFDARTDRGGGLIRRMYDGEQEFLSDILNELDQDDVFFDIGANIGLFSCFAGQVISEGHVVAFEPYPPNVRQLRQNLSYNLSESRYKVCDVVLSNSRETVDFTAPDNDPGNQIGNISPVGESIEVQAVSGDELVTENKIPEPNVVKIDVEGAEPFVIDGLAKKLRNDNCRLLYCEIHLPRRKSGSSRPSVEDYGETQESILEKITKLGFEVEYTKLRDREVHVKAVK